METKTKTVLDHRVTIECSIDAESVISAYLNAHGVVGLLELVQDGVERYAHGGSEFTQKRCKKAVKLLDKVIDEVQRGGNQW